MLAALLSSLGLALPAGLNAWLPFLILALADRYTSQIDLDAPFDFISSTPGLIIILLLLPIELLVDKIPGADHVSDLAHTFIRPVAGAILAAAVADASHDLNVWFAAILGVGGAGATHAVKMSTRPVITASTGGVGNPVASIVEDVASVVSSLIAIFVPLLLIVILPLIGFALYSTWKRLRRGSERLRAAVRRSQ
ncbi:MAG TPA: DUF4126 domain-containing protein [Thermomicrobiales bacterium]|nr:DUF4126 domain-containing protein [Thermomicrobiales bacterium]